MEQVDSNNFQIACQRHFEFSHKTEEIVPINHPNQFFEQSMRLLNGKSQQNRPSQSQSIKKEHVKIEMTQ